jgi:hypothetical protein
MSNRENFDKWFADYIRSLARDPNAGFLLTMVSFPLLERYLRQHTNAVPKSPSFIKGLLKLFPELQSDAVAQSFWTIYRHGLLHNVTMSRESHGLTLDSPRAVEVQADGKVWLNPVLFAERVVATIDRDFETFERGQPLSTVNVYGIAPGPHGSPSSYVGTGLPPSPGTGSKII